MFTYVELRIFSPQFFRKESSTLRTNCRQIDGNIVKTENFLRFVTWVLNFTRAAILEFYDVIRTVAFMLPTKKSSVWRHMIQTSGMGLETQIQKWLTKFQFRFNDTCFNCAGFIIRHHWSLFLSLTFFTLIFLSVGWLGNHWHSKRPRERGPTVQPVQTLIGPNNTRYIRTTHQWHRDCRGTQGSI